MQQGEEQELIPGLVDCIVEHHVFTLMSRKMRHRICLVSKKWLSSLTNLSLAPKHCVVSFAIDHKRMELLEVSGETEIDRYDIDASLFNSFFLCPNGQLWKCWPPDLSVMDLSAWKWEWKEVGEIEEEVIGGVVCLKGETYAVGTTGWLYKLDQDCQWICLGKGNDWVLQASVDSVNDRIVGLKPDKDGFSYLMELDVDRNWWTKVAYLDCSKGCVHVVSPQGKVVSQIFRFEDVVHPPTRLETRTSVMLLQDKQEHVYVRTDPTDVRLKCLEGKPADQEVCDEEGAWQGEVKWETSDIVWKKVSSKSLWFSLVLTTRESQMWDGQF